MLVAPDIALVAAILVVILWAVKRSAKKRGK
jgi:hypothetical protein